MGTTYTKVEPPADGLIKARREGGRFVNSFNPNYTKPGFFTILRWMLGSPNNTRLPREPETLDEQLPVIKHRKEEIFQESTGLRFLWIGHASCLVQMDDFIFLTDPVFGERCGITPKLGPKRFRPPALVASDLPDKLQAVVISHNHYDHLDYPSVRAINTRFGKDLTWFCGEGTRQWFLDAGIANVVELTWWQQWQHPTNADIRIAFCPAQHWSRRTAFNENKALWGGYAVCNRNYKFYFAGDTGYTDGIEIFKQIGQQYGPFDLSAIPIGAYEPRWMMESQHVSPDEAVQIHLDTQSKQSVGIHWGTWALANEYFLEPREKLVKAVENNQLNPNSFIVIKHGEILHVPKHD